MLFADIAIMDEGFECRPGRYIGVKDGVIDYIGTQPPANAANYGTTYDGTGKLLMPALFNAHAHAPMTLLRGFAENLPLDRWLNEKCWPFEAKMTDDDNYWATLLACAEMARYGVAGFSDMYYSTTARAKAVTEAGLKANLCEGFIAFEPKPYRDYPIAAANEEYVRTLHGSANGRIKIDYNIHAEYTSNEQTCRDIVALLKDNGLRLHLHLSETEKEVAECKERHGGLSPVEYFERIGAFDVPCTAAHCVWLSDADVDILDAHGVFVANNPVGLIYKGSNLDPTAVEPAQALRAATRTGALSQGRDDCGLVKEGFRADVCVLDVTGPQWCPMTAPAYNVVFAGDGSDVVLTMCDGEVVYDGAAPADSRWPGMDIERVKAEVTARAQRIISEL